MGLVDHKGGLVALADFDQLVNRGYIAFHGEDTVGDDQFGGLDGYLLEHTLQVVHVTMLVFEGVGEGDELAFHDGGVVQFVVDEVVVASHDAGDGA